MGNALSRLERALRLCDDVKLKPDDVTAPNQEISRNGAMASPSSSAAALGAQDPLPVDYLNEAQDEPVVSVANAVNLDESDENSDHGRAAPNSRVEGNHLQDRSLVMDLHSHLNDVDIADVKLVGTDGKTVVAVRSLLAMRSAYFRTLFFGSFRESSLEQVKLGYSSLVIKAVVEYCYTDEIKTAFENLSFEETARSMVGLVCAGQYFELVGLESKANRLTCLMMDEYPSLACAVLDEVSLTNESSELGRVALGIIRLRTDSSLLPPDSYGLGVQSLGEAAMERVMADSEIHTPEFTLFLCLKKWVDYTTDVTRIRRNDEMRHDEWRGTLISARLSLRLYQRRFKIPT